MDIPNANCLLCDEDTKSIYHLFGSCPFVKSLWSKFTLALGFVQLPGSWDEIIVAARIKAKGNRFPVNVFKCDFAAIVYHVWTEKNARVFDRIRRIIDQTWNDIVFDCGAYIRTWRRVPKSERAWNICRDWKVAYEEITSFGSYKGRYNLLYFGL
ncbi:uncharacterized protein LOC124912318 [Impatiens glandulifera]|uniref:uncharacterized protein LOC124912318 n=1 Tax=Impatiens glandulifera TaxID=253017 RepID=UPI001FB10628|nr:uncharacterized protein LOC124912318 [Impatiens glandulifera]